MGSALVSGKLGDLFHSLYVPFCYHQKTGQPCKVYMTDKVEPFENGLVNTYNELKDIILKQEWCSGFEIWDGQPIAYDTTKFREHPLLYRACWTEILTSLCFGNAEPIQGGWIKWGFKKYEKRLVINRRYKNPLPPHIQANYESIFGQYSEVIFLGSEHDYNLFPLKNMCKLVVPLTIKDWLSYISQSAYFIGNQSAPLAMASALGAKRLGELLPRQYPDWIHYANEGKYGDIALVQ